MPRTSSASIRASLSRLASALKSPPGWNEAHGRAANYTYPDGVISSDPHIGSNFFTINNAKFLPQPRIAVAWSPLGPKTVLRAGFGMYNDLQDALGYRADQNAPFNPVYSLSNYAVSKLPIDPAAPVPTGAKLVPGGVQPNMQTPTLISWSLRVQRELSPNTVLTVGYIGSQGYHELIGVDANEPVPVICPASPCPSVYPTCESLSADEPHQFAYDGISPWLTSRRSTRSCGIVLHPVHRTVDAESKSSDCKHLDLVLRGHKFL